MPKNAENRTFCAKRVQKMRKKCRSPHFSALFRESAETPLLVQINVFAVWPLRLDRKYTQLKGKIVSEFPHFFRDLRRPGLSDFLLLKSVGLDWFMVSSCLSRWPFTPQTLAVYARNRTKTTKFKSDVLESPVILMPGFFRTFSDFFRIFPPGLSPSKQRVLAH